MLPLAGVRVLVAEDNAVNQRVVMGLLKKLGCRGDVVANGLEAIDALKQRSYDLVLMVCQMPELDGFEATERIRNGAGLNPGVPIIALTPFVEVQRRLALSWGVVSRLLRKVKTTDEMVEEVEASLLNDGSVHPGDVIVIISGSPMWVRGTTNLLKLHRVGERRA